MRQYKERKKKLSVMSIIAGVDEAGRGSFFGPVFAGCVIWDDEVSHKLLKDSKKLSKKQRNEMRNFIIENCIAWSVGSANNKYIDENGILPATMKAMHDSINGLYINVDELYIDGNIYKPQNKMEKYKCFVKGDSLYKSISAASILAKTFHDDYIQELCEDNPYYHNVYDMKNNMGYGTLNHINGIKKYGITDFHRKSFLKKYYL